MLKKISIILNILFLGLIISPKNLKLYANDKPIYISNLGIFSDGIYKILETDSGFIIYNDFKSSNYSWYCDFELINYDYLYDYDDVENDYQKFAIKILNGNQENLNFYNIVDFQLINDGLYYFEFDESKEHQVVMDLSTKVKYQIRTLEFTFFDDLSKYYKLEHEFNNKIFTYYLAIVQDGQLLDISNTLLFFNLIATNYKLFFIDEKVNDYFAKVHDENRSYNIYSNPSNYYVIKEKQYLLYSYTDDKYVSVDKIYIDNLILDLINKEYNYHIFAPSIIDFLDNMLNHQNKIINEVLGYDTSSDVLNGLYLNGLNNMIFKVDHYDYEEKITQDLKKFTRKYQFYPKLSYKNKPAIIESYLYKNSDFRINDDSIINIYGFSYFTENTELIFFINNEQIDISLLSIKDIVWLLETINSGFINNKLSYQNYVNNTILESDVIDITSYTDIPNTKGFVKIVKNGNYHNIYLYNNYNNKYYLYKKIDIIDKLQDDPLDYKITFEKNDMEMLLYFSNNNESLTWDVINKKYSKIKNVYVTSDKLHTTVVNENGISYNYLHFNLNINPDKIENLTVNYNTRLNYYHGLTNRKVSSDVLKNVTKTINSDESQNIELTKSTRIGLTFSVYQSKEYFDNKKSRLANSISSSNVSGYNHMVLLDYDYSRIDMYYFPIINYLKVTRTYEQLTLLEISYWEDGFFYENIKVDDQFPGGEYESPKIDDLISKLKKLANNIWKKTINLFKSFPNYVSTILFVFAIIFIFSVFGKTKYYRKMRRRR